MKTQIITFLLFLLFPALGFSQYPEYHVGGTALQAIESTYLTVKFKRKGRTQLPNSDKKAKAYRVLIYHGGNQGCKLWEEFYTKGIQLQNPCTGLRNDNNNFIRYARPEEFLNLMETLGWEMEEEVKRKNRIRGSHHLIFIYRKKDS